VHFSNLKSVADVSPNNVIFILKRFGTMSVKGQLLKYKYELLNHDLTTEPKWHTVMELLNHEDEHY
jgi:hypothetical protein